MTRRALAFALAALVLGGCKPSPTKQFWNGTYVGFIQDRLKEYDQAMADLVAVEVQLDPDKQQVWSAGQQPPPPTLTVDQAVGELETKVLPELDKVATASNVKLDNFPPTIAAFHKSFADALAQKAAAYRAMCAAYHAKDKDAFSRARNDYASASSKLADWRTTYSQYLDAGGPPDPP